MLTTFKKPTPDPALIKKMISFNRIVNLYGIPFFKKIPGIGQLVPFTGICDIISIKWEDENFDSLKNLFKDNSTVFIGPNHPEYFTDWMLDKEISARVSPLMAFMATHTVVNGMGPFLQKFWLKNNICAQIPGTGAIDAKEYLIDSALKGHGALLHPEGHVGWHSDKISPLFPGLVDMAYDAYQKEPSKKIYIVPMCWKLVFVRNEHVSLISEINRIRDNLVLPPSTKKCPEDMLGELFSNIFVRIAEMHNLSVPVKINGEYSKVPLYKAALIAALIQKLSESTELSSATAPSFFKEIKKKLKDPQTKYSPEKEAEIKKLLQSLERMMRFDFSYYEGLTLTQENIAELLQLIRTTFCHKTWKDKLHQFIPRPIGPRIAHVRVGAPVEVSELFNQCAVASVPALKEKLLAQHKSQLQKILDELNLSLHEEYSVYKNIFHK